MVNGFENWFQQQQKIHPDANRKILQFIFRFQQSSPDMIRVFTTGYCYYFAVLLKDAFDGNIYLNPEKDHIIWSNDRKVFYDITGVCNGQIKKSSIVEVPKEKLKSFRKV